MTHLTYKKTQANRLDMKIESILLLHTRNTPQPQKQTSPPSKGLGKKCPIKLTQETVAILISNNIDFKLKSFKRDIEGHFILVTGKTHQEEISILNINALNSRTPSYIKETHLKLKSHIKSNTLILGDFFNTPFSPLDRSVRQKN